jgi:hypothetical protein
MSTSATRAIHLDRLRAAPPDGIRRPRVAGALLTTLRDGAAAVVVVLAIPFVVLAAGTPVALAILVLLWAGRQLLAAF